MDVERSCPQLYKRRSDGTWQEARLDLVVHFPGALQTVMVDVTVLCPHARGRERSHTAPALAAKSGESAKLSRYGDTVLPLAFESHGRLGPKSIGTLDTLAAWAATSVPWRMLDEKAIVRRWRSSLEVVLLHEKADLLVQSLGGNGAGWVVS